MSNQPLNHPVGHGDPASILPQIVPTADPAQIDLGKVDIHCGLFEMPYAEAMALLPASLHPSTPAYGSLTFYRVHESPVGGFEFAVAGIACRNTIKPRMMTVSAFASNPEAAQFLSDNWGYPCRVADVRARQPYHGAISEILIDGKCIARMRTENAEFLLGMARAVRYPQAINLSEVDGKIGLLQVDMVYDYDQSYRGNVIFDTFDAEAMTGGRIHPTDMIAATVVSAGLLIKPRRILLDLDQVGGVTKLAATEQVAA
ncbi:MAG: hypothetical protein EOO82_00555 [Oxalobacteraceae bacterium]|nr:MAG: hypothetical protein EOO82_00555 [Oxalobacteraceae bacterium]